MPEALLRELQELDLSVYEARTLLALLKLGSANSAELARHSGVPRTSTYQVMEELNRKGLAQRLPSAGPATWATPGRAEVVERLDALMEERLRQQKARTARVGELLASSFPNAPLASTAEVQVLPAAQVPNAYARILVDTQSELLVFNRRPYSKGPGQVNPGVLEALRRGVKSRTLYEASHWHDPAAEAFREAMNEYHRAGVLGALVEELPVKLVVADRRVALVALTGDTEPDADLQASLLVEHAGFAALQAEAFETLWSRAEPVESAPAVTGRTGRTGRKARRSSREATRAHSEQGGDATATDR